MSEAPAIAVFVRRFRAALHQAPGAEISQALLARPGLIRPRQGGGLEDQHSKMT